MELKQILDNKGYKKDIQKGQKIVAAIYVLTRHLSDTDPLKDTLRSQAVALITSAPEVQRAAKEHIETLLGGAVIAGLISEKNTSIVVYEISRYIEREHDLRQEKELSLDTLFESQDTHHASHVSLRQGHAPHTFHKRHESVSHLSLKSPHAPLKDIQKDSQKSAERIMNKASRQDKILAFINDRKSAVIKDIVALFPDVSEKTIQRELTTLIDTGRITKRGSKRWSIYMAVNSLL